jgi:hypothetical protein
MVVRPLDYPREVEIEMRVQFQKRLRATTNNRSSSTSAKSGDRPCNPYRNQLPMYNDTRTMLCVQDDLVVVVVMRSDISRSVAIN